MEGDTLGQAGHAVTGTGGGGTGGHYMFANLEDLGGIIAEWEALHARIHARGEKLWRAMEMIVPPANDVMSRLQASAALRSLKKAEEHRVAMESYAAGYIEKLRDAQGQYATTDAESAARLRKVDED